jgi:RND family efflux transporter MFP subunit
MKKNIGIIILLVSILLTIILISLRPEIEVKKTVKKLPYVKTTEIQSQTINATISSQGVIVPETSLTILSELSSKVEWLSPKMDPGSNFNKNDTLIILDPRDYELALITAKSNVLNAEVNLEKEKAESDLANKEWERVGVGIGSDLTLRKPQLAQAKATLAAAEANLEQANRNLERAIITSQFDGRVRIRDVEIGTTVFPGTVLAKIYGTDYFEVRLVVADQDVSFTGLDFNGESLSRSKQLKVEFSQGSMASNYRWNGNIVRTEAEVDPLTRMLAIVARIDNRKMKATSQTPLAIGQYVSAAITGIEIENVSLIPRTLVRNESVWVIDDKKVLRKRNVEILRFENENAFIGNGFAIGDRLLITRLSSLVDGLKVTYDLD